jgi:AcrB/AcrD/AcrF family
MFGLGGVSGYLFRPLAEAVIVAMTASYLWSRTLVPTMAHYLLSNQVHGAEGRRGCGAKKISRSALIELQADNPEGKLWPGSFTEVHFHLDAKGQVLHVRPTALYFGPRGIEVASLTPDDRVSFSGVQLGRDLCREVEVLSGSPDAAVIDSPPESLTAGQVVRVAKQTSERPDASLRPGRPAS